MTSDPITTPRDDEVPADHGLVAALGQAPSEIAEIAGDAGAQARNLVGEARTQLQHQAEEQTSRAAEGLRRASIDLDTMASASPRPDGPMAEAARQLARAGARAGEHLERRGIDGVVSDVGGFARRHPGAFLGIAFGIGVAAGRLLRSDVEHRRERDADQEPDIDLRTAPITAGGVPSPMAAGDLPPVTGGDVVGVGGSAPLGAPLPAGGAV